MEKTFLLQKDNSKAYYRKAQGITLIALVVTIVVLLILAGITISLVFSENGIIAKAREAAEKTNQAVINEQKQMNDVTAVMENGGSTIPEEPEEISNDGSYSETEKVNTPKLTAEMEPIKWDAENSRWIKADKTSSDWYNYSAGEWANVVIGGDFDENGVLNENANGYSMFVWIPRYAYSIPSAGYHKSTATEISIEFLKEKSNEIGDSEAAKEITITNESGAGKWNVHPAFNYGEAVSGLWVAKFEASQNGSAIQVKPGVSSWRSINVSTIYTNCLNYDSTTLGNANLNSHMMKNDEWGAVAYLSRSKYGKNDEVTINGSSSYYTGGGTENAYATTNTAQSTTGNVYGVYDMSGGAWEYVAAYVNNGNSNLDNGSSLVNGDSKTKNVYEKGSSDNSSSNYSANTGVYGDAVYETSTSGSGTTSWYGDYSGFPSLDWTFFCRGGDYGSGSNAGVFCFVSGTGSGTGSTFSFRPVLVAL